MKNDPYKALGVGEQASQEEIKDAYRKLAQQLHPDRHPDDQVEATKRFQELEEAYRFLSDEDQRARFDDLGEDFQNELQAVAAELLIHFEKQMVDHPELDHAKLMRDMISKNLDAQRSSIPAVRLKIRSLQAIAKRWKKNGGRNIFSNYYARQVVALEKQIKEVEKAIEISLAARKMLDDYEFRPASKSTYEAHPLMIRFNL